MSARLLKIGELAQLFGVTPRTIRYYEELGLIEASNRTEGLHRRYPADVIIRLRRLGQLKSLGLSLSQIREFFDLEARDPSGELCRLLLLGIYEDRKKEEEALIQQAEERIRNIDERIAALKAKTSFFSCPGEECAGCDFSGTCDGSSHHVTESEHK